MAENELKITSEEQVALELMRIIADRESDDTQKYEKPDARTYYLTLFQQCIKAGHANRTIESILAGGGMNVVQQTRVIR
jgi:hypothetical protein